MLLFSFNCQLFRFGTIGTAYWSFSKEIAFKTRIEGDSVLLLAMIGCDMEHAVKVSHDLLSVEMGVHSSDIAISYRNKSNMFRIVVTNISKYPKLVRVCGFS